MNDKTNLNTMVNLYYWFQEMRIRTENRIRDTFEKRAAEQNGLKPDKLFIALRKEYDCMLAGNDRDMIGNKNYRTIWTDNITNLTEFAVVRHFVELERMERFTLGQLHKLVQDEPIYKTFLEHVRGIGPAMASVIISEIDIRKARTPSSLWKYAGLDVTNNGEGRTRKKEHLVDRRYANSNGVIKTRKSIAFNPFLKAKLTGVLGPSFLRTANDDKYAKLYYTYRKKISEQPAHADKPKGRLHAMAIRYMIKRFLVDLYNKWRALEKLPVAVEYSKRNRGL